MRLYGAAASPFVQRVLMAARAKGHELALTPPLGGSIHSPEFQAISPTGRIPLLALDEGRRIAESSAIAAYLDEVLDGPSLMPVDLVARARVREIEALAALEYAAGLRPVMLGVVFGRPVADGVVEAARAQAAKGADALDRLLDGAGRYAVGDALTLADCILAPTLQLARVVDARAGTAALVDDRPRLASYMARVGADPIVGRSIAEMREGFAAILAPSRG